MRSTLNKNFSVQYSILTISSVLYSRRLELFHLMTETLNPLNSNFPFLPSPSPYNHHSIFCFSSSTILDTLYKWNHVVFILMEIICNYTRKEILSCATTWMKLEDITLSEMSQS